MSKIYFISDCHFGHKNIIKYRPQFSSIEEHDYIILDNIMNVANKRNVLFILGDTIITPDSLQIMKTICDGFLKVRFILGNHDFERTSPHKGESDNYMVDNVMYHNVYMSDFLRECSNLTFYGMKYYKEFACTHAPIIPIEARGHINIHGHTHDYALKSGEHSINVSCEAINFTPISMERLREFWHDNGITPVPRK